MKLIRSFAVAVSVALLSVPLSFAQSIDPDLLSGLKARSIGPATMSGRVAAIAAAESNPDIVYVGAGTGGVWKSVDGGIRFRPIFDDQPVNSIGAIAVAANNPDDVWVGSGESNIRNSISVGNGVYRSLDGGKTWKHLGLEKTEHISRVLLDPTNPQVAYVAAMGAAWGSNADRGVYKTTDGGATWKKVLYVDEHTGAADMTIDPTNPNKIFAAMWEYQRWPWFFRSGGPSSGLYVTLDGGASWKRYTEDDGMPKGNLGRIGLDISRSNPNVVYALVEADKSALLRSDDGGRSWKSVNTNPDVAERPFYFSEIHVDPSDPNHIYNLWTGISASTDGGKTFRTIAGFRAVHPDHHAMWINPKDPLHLFDGNDGGVAVSHDGGNTWRFVGNLPLGQFYHIDYDMMTPYNVYGGLQDNGSWRGPSSVWENGGIRNSHWTMTSFGDGFRVIPIANDPTTGYSMSQEAYIVRWDLKTGQRKDIRPASPQGTDLRFNWNAGLAVDPFDPNTVYLGSQFVHRSTNRGDSWQIISPDLTTNNKEWQNQKKSGGITPDVTGAENFTTIISIAPSPVAKGEIWVGTDDGRVQLTRDAGANWTSVEANLKGVPKNTWVPHIEASRHDAGTAYVVFDNHRREDMAPYVLKTADYGKTWTNLGTKDVKGHALTLSEDPVDPKLLFLGTELGLFVSFDGGANWMPFKGGFPTASTMALAIQPRESDLIIGTHGRSIWIVDDIRPLRHLTKSVLDEPIHLFDIADAQQHETNQTPGELFPGETTFRGENRPYGALITFSLNDPSLPLPNEERERERKEKLRASERKPLPITPAGVPQQALDVPKGPAGTEAAKTPQAPSTEAKTSAPGGPSEEAPKAEITISDSTGKVIRTIKTPVKLGINRASWDLARDAFKRPSTPGEEESFFGGGGPEVLPGTYNVTVKFGKHETKGTVRVVADPRFQIADADRQAKWNAIMHGGNLIETATKAIEQIRQTRSDIDASVARVNAAAKARGDKEDSTANDPVVKGAKDVRAALDKAERELWTPPETHGIVPEDDMTSKLQYAVHALESSWDAPTPAQLEYLRQAEEKLRATLADVNRTYAEDVAKYRETVRKSQLELFPEVKPLEVPKP